MHGTWSTTCCNFQWLAQDLSHPLTSFASKTIIRHHTPSFSILQEINVHRVSLKLFQNEPKHENKSHPWIQPNFECVFGKGRCNRDLSPETIIVSTRIVCMRLRFEATCFVMSQRWTSCQGKNDSIQILPITFYW